MLFKMINDILHFKVNLDLKYGNELKTLLPRSNCLLNGRLDYTTLPK